MIVGLGQCQGALGQHLREGKVAERDIRLAPRSEGLAEDAAVARAFGGGDGPLPRLARRREILRVVQYDGGVEPALGEPAPEGQLLEIRDREPVEAERGLRAGEVIGDVAQVVRAPGDHEIVRQIVGERQGPIESPFRFGQVSEGERAGGGDVLGPHLPVRVPAAPESVARLDGRRAAPLELAQSPGGHGSQEQTVR